MKKVFTITAFAISFSANAQITIDNSDMPSANDTVRMSNAVDIWGIDPTETGANYIWDFSFLEPNSQELDTFFSVTSTPFAYQFFFNNQFVYPEHKATFARKGTDFDLFGAFTMTNVYDFYKVDAGQFSNVGFGANINGLPASIRSMPVDTIYAFPLDYLDAYTSHGEWEMAIPGTFTYGQSKVRDVVVEGWGSITTPLGTFQALKVKMDIDVTDTMAIDSLGINFSFPRPTTTEYHWLAPGMNVPVLQINTLFGVITSIQYQDSLRILNLGTNDIALEAPIIYPNPATDQLIINTDSKSLLEKIEIIDLEGKIINSQKGFNAPMAVIDVCNLSNGIYFLLSTSDKGISRSKITIAR